MAKEKIDFDLSELSLDDLIKAKVAIREFIDFLESAPVAEDEE